MIHAFSGRGLSKIHGFRNIQNLLYGRLKPAGIQMTNLNGIRMLVNPSDIGIAPGLFAGNYEIKETMMLKNLIKEGMIIVDIGANIGYYTLLASKCTGCQGKVYAFEPEPDNFRLLSRNVSLNHADNIVAVNKAVSNKAGKCRLFIDRKFLGSHSLSAGNLETKKNAESISVETVSLDSFFNETRNIDLIKMDAQGAEGMIIDGGMKTLKRTENLFIELWPYGVRNFGYEPDDITNKLKKLGFHTTRELPDFNKMLRHESANLFFCRGGMKGKICGREGIVKPADRGQIRYLLCEKCKKDTDKKTREANRYRKKSGDSSTIAPTYADFMVRLPLHKEE